ncbi:ABC transporter substrate-binding protein [Chloroflexota bacterium]
MKLNKTSLFFLLISLMLAMSLVACGTPSSTPEQEKTIKIGLIADLTGPVSGYAQDIEDAANFSLNQIGWELEGRDIELIIEDGASNPDAAVDKARKLVEVDKVHVILGPILTDSYIAVAGFLKTREIPYIYIHVGANEAVKAGAPGAVFASGGQDIGASYPIGLWAAESGYKTATTITTDIAYGWNSHKGFVLGFEEGGGEVVQTQSTTMATMDYLPYLLSLDDADILGFFLTALDTVTFVKQYRDYGGQMPLFGFHDTMITTFGLEELGDLGLGITTNSAWAYNIGTPENEAFIDDFLEWSGRPPTQGFEMFYNAVQLFLEAVRVTEGDTTPDALINALHSIDKVFPRGRVTVDADGFVISDQYIVEVVNTNKYGYVWEQFDQVERPVIK